MNLIIAMVVGRVITIWGQTEKSRNFGKNI